MSIFYLCETIRRNGQTESIQKDFASSEIIVGRGGKSDVILTGTLVSLEHACFAVRDGEFFVEDLNSLTGVRVNGVAVTKRSVGVNDKISVGETTLVVARQDEHWGIRETRREEQDTSGADAIARAVGALSPSKNLPPLFLLSMVLIAAIVIPFLAFPFGGTYLQSWNSGPISNAHSMLEKQCTDCHATPFQPVQDSRCESCHHMTDHAPVLPKLVAEQPQLHQRCAECHMEHNGTSGIIVHDAAMCSSCHGELGRVSIKTTRHSIDNFETHPEFRVAIRSSYDSDETERISLDKKAELIDRSGIKLNHKKHLEQDLQGPDGRVTLTCNDCHTVSPFDGTIEPIQFEQHCSECHPLTFDERLKKAEVPHGEPDVVFNFMYAEYAKLYLKDKEDDPEPEPEFDLRRKPGFQAKVAQEPKKQTEFARQVIFGETRYSEQDLFERKACQLCHVVNEKNLTERFVQKSKYSIVRPVIPERWMPASIFSHRAHDEVQCESCHSGVKESTETENVMLPGVAGCKQCHSGVHERGKVQSDCSLCHSYHEMVPLHEDRKRSIDQIVTAAQEGGR